MKFNPQEHLTKIKGKSYLEVKWRLVWFRKEHPDYGINTEFLLLDIDQGIAICQATIKNENSRPLAQGTKTEYKASFFDYIEKAETGAIGRALATLGYGTQFAPELEEGKRIVDSLVNPKKKTKEKQKQQIINQINSTIAEKEITNKEAQEVLKENFAKQSLKECSLTELKKYLQVLEKELIKTS
ncbi:hypothetical protein [Fuchsiella alkaliacetigena]|uniref:hypothetical protein n=1 Tax=Fuchsiella alkaliacetigena TaxID=957042 RepID=UPI00200A99BE|nr:hypothetical protein [Fuchsiella alkaliacetigena]MCK8824922.1 hypothetical protein [Fuchsiella alkaliacetigena]